jgi:hypothetical protein
MALRLAALAMTTLTIGLLVVLPSRMEADSRAYAMFAASRAGEPCVTAIPAKCLAMSSVDEAPTHAVSIRVTERRCDVQG